MTERIAALVGLSWVTRQQAGRSAAWGPIALAVLLYILYPRRARGGEERVDFKVLYYQENDDRIRVLSPTFLYEHEVSPTLTVKIDGIYNAISGATPTGAPPIPYTVIRSDALLNAAAFALLSGATSQAAPSTGGGGGGGGGGNVALRSVGPISQTTGLEVQTAELQDTRVGGNVEVIKRRDRDTITAQMSGSVESDYISIGLALKDAIEFNQKNTTLLIGGAVTHDLIDSFATGATETKDSFDILTGVTQILTPKSLVSANLTLGYVSGYLDDPYKVVQVNDTLVPEHRPDSKTKEILYLTYLRHSETLRGTAELGYRFYNDSFGIRGNTFSIAWLQKIGDRIVLKPALRYYDQTEADFYGVRFFGAPEDYSADYRVSALTAVSYGLKATFNQGERLSFDIGVERYKQEGQDDETLAATYPEANIVTAGMRLWF